MMIRILEKVKDTLISTTSEADKSSDLYLSEFEPQIAANHDGSSSPKRPFAISDYASESDSNERQHKRGKFFSSEKSPSASTLSFPTSKDGTHSSSMSSCSSDNEGLPDCSDLSDFSETAQTNTAEQNLSSIKEDYELGGMFGEIIGLLEDAKALNESFEGKDYSKEEYMASVNDFVSELKEQSSFLLNSCREAIEKEAEKVLSPATETVETQPRIISNDPAERKGIQLTEQEKNFLIYKVPH